MNTSNEYLFGVSRGRLTTREIKRRKKIAARHNATFLYCDMPGEGPKSWFAAPNRGHPFDAALSREVMAEVEDLPDPAYSESLKQFKTDLRTMQTKHENR